MDARPTPANDQSAEEAIAAIRRALQGLAFGTIRIKIHEGRVSDIEVTRKRRLR